MLPTARSDVAGFANNFSTGTHRSTCCIRAWTVILCFSDGAMTIIDEEEANDLRSAKDCYE